MLSVFVEMMENEQRTLQVVIVCGYDGNGGNDGNGEHCTLSLFVEMMETEQRTLYIVIVCGSDGNRTENIVCCQCLWK